MSAKRVALDTNILVYSVDLDAGKKHEKAIELADVRNRSIYTAQDTADRAMVLIRDIRKLLGLA